MRRITLWLLSTVAALVLLFSYHTSTMGTGGTESSPVAGAVPRPAVTGGPSGDDGAGSVGGGTTGQQGNGTYRGSVVRTRWGPIQVTITVASRKITNVAVPIYPNGNPRDEEINSYALPILRQATLDAQSADIDTVSGATVTSDGYHESLQAAIDAAHLS
ncbi:MAG TPA: FMN-binding protein [Micromonosporaceae bacterium]